MFKISKYTKIGPYGLGAVVLITVAVLLRAILIGNGWPLTNSDEATMGLQALHILTRGEWPIFLYGQNYMGTLEAYLAACFFGIFGPSILALRLGLVIMYAGFLFALYLLARLLYSKGVALAVVFFLCWGSRDTLSEQLTAIGGQLETLLFGTLSLLLTSWLVLSFHPDISSREQPPEEARQKRLITYGCLGGVIGLGLWSHMLVLPFVCMSLLLLLLFCPGELRTQASLFGVVGFLIGSFPLLLFNIEHPLDNSLVTLWQMYRAVAPLGPVGPLLPVELNFGTHLLAAVLIALPTATGLHPLCLLSSESQWIHSLSFSCMGFQACWGLGVVIVWTLATSLGIKELLEAYLDLSASGSPAQKQHLVRYACRLMVLASAGLTGLSYAVSPSAVVFPASSARYLVGLSVATPAMIAFLWPRFSLNTAGFTRVMTVCRIGKVVDCLKIGVLSLISILLICAMMDTLLQIPEAQKGIQRQQTLLHGLLGLHAPHIYSDYWTCNRLIFLSDEHIICSVLNPDLSPGQNRYQAYVQIVKQDSQSARSRRRPAYVFDLENGGVGIFQDQTFSLRFGAQYHRLSLRGYAIYLAHDHR